LRHLSFALASLSFFFLSPSTPSKKKNETFLSHLADALELPWPSPEALEALSLLEEPVILRGGAMSFLKPSSEEEEERAKNNNPLSNLNSAENAKAAEATRWSLDALARASPTQRVLVRASPTPSFPVPNGALLPLVVAVLGTKAAPTLASTLPLREAAERM